MKSTRNVSQSKSRGFTLVEILVVTTIIAILAGLLFTGFASAVRITRNADAENTAHHLKNAIHAYYAEYHRYPFPDGDRGDNKYEDFATNEAFMEILLGADTESAKKKNPNRTKFFTARTAKRGGPNSYIKGIALNEDGSGAGSLWDFWGRMYGVRIDKAKRDQLLNPALEKPTLSGKGAPVWGEVDETGPRYLSESVVVWSSGKNLDRSADNIVTW